MHATVLHAPFPQIFGPSTGTEVQAISTYYSIEKCPLCIFLKSTEGLSEQGLPWVPWHPQILADLLNLSQPEGASYATAQYYSPPRFSDLPTSLNGYCCFGLALYQD